MLKGRFLTLCVSTLFCLSCANEFFEDKPDGSISANDPVRTVPCTPGEDADSDKILNEIDGCNEDLDGDKLYNYEDYDSDGDKVYDQVEGTMDSDGDKKPDFLDTDSDNDGVLDGDEDLNGDGFLGCCMTSCNEKREGCTLNEEGCGNGQSCQSGKCTPSVDLLCSDGESHRRKANTFPGEPMDSKLSFFICHPSSETSNKGLKRLLFKTSPLGQWKVALETTAQYSEVRIPQAEPKEAGACIDLKNQGQGVAGFVISMPAPDGDVVQISNALITKLKSLPGQTSVTQLSSGNSQVSQDNFPSVVSTQLNIKMNGTPNPPTVRNAVMETLFGKKLEQMSPGNYGPSTNDHYLKFQTLLRKDGRIIVMGAVASVTLANDTNVQTGILLDDLSNGTGLATHLNRDTVECDPFRLEGNPVADIIWVMDESGSMGDNRADVANNAKDFFARALKSGLDFRMAVTGVNKNNNGKFCSVASTNSSDDGGPDRFLLPSEQDIFEACIKNPPNYEGGYEYSLVNGREAVARHLPRQPNDPAKIRTGATLVVIFATDEGDQDYKNHMGTQTGNEYLKRCQATSAEQTKTLSFLKPDLDLYTGKSSWGQDAMAIVHLIGGVCSNSCSAEIGHDFNELVKATSGVTADVCQKNLGTSLQIIIDSITGGASQAKLEYVPISASLAVAIENQVIPRSRSQGFDYTASTNSLRFIGITYPKGKVVVASYRRFKDQGPGIDP